MTIARVSEPVEHDGNCRAYGCNGGEARLRAVLLEVIEAGDSDVKGPWPLDHPFPAVANDARNRFVDAVIGRLNLPLTS